MTITLELAPASEALLTDMADRQGQDKTKIAASLLEGALENAAGRVTPVVEWDADFRAKYNIPADLEPLSEEELRALDPEDEGEAIRLGLADALAGRMTPAGEWKAKFRARHNIPEGGEPMSHEETLQLDAKASLCTL